MIRMCSCYPHYNMEGKVFHAADLEKKQNPDRTFDPPCIYNIYVCIYKALQHKCEIVVPRIGFANFLVKGNTARSNKCLSWRSTRYKKCWCIAFARLHHIYIYL